MAVILNLKPEIEAGLVDQARAKGLTLEQYLLSMVEGIALTATQKTLTPEQRAAAFEAWATGHQPTQNLSDYAVSRESMYYEDDQQ